MTLSVLIYAMMLCTAAAFAGILVVDAVRAYARKPRPERASERAPRYVAGRAQPER